MCFGKETRCRLICDWVKLPKRIAIRLEQFVDFPAFRLRFADAVLLGVGRA